MDVQILKVAFQLKHPAIFGLNSARNVIAPNKIKTIATNDGGDEQNTRNQGHSIIIVQITTIVTHKLT